MTPAPPGPPTTDIVTFGCRLNAYESEVMRQHARALGLADTVIVNTCAVTREAERQARQAIRRARRARPEARIIVTGCAAQLEPAAFAAMPEVDEVLGNSEKLRRESFAPGGEPVRVNDILAIRETAGHLVADSSHAFAGRARAFLQVQNGCDHRCTFCIIPFARGPSRSVPVGAVVREARGLVAEGVPEVVLTGVDIGAYGKDLPGRPSLSRLVVKLLHHVPELRRLRLSSIDPNDVDDELLALFGGEARLMPHLHLSLQAGDDMVLKRMKRRHTTAEAEALCTRARAERPDIVFGADLIAGFPTESEAMFANTLGHVRALGLTYLHVFPYSERPGTPAARMPAVSVPTRKERAQRLRRAGAAARRDYFASRRGVLAAAVVETRVIGRTEHFAEVRLSWPLGVSPAPPGAIVETRITGQAEDALTGEVIL